MERASTLPPLRHYFGEARIGLDWARGKRVEAKLAREFQGRDRSVVVIPGLFTNDNRTRMLRRVLARAGYDAHGWGLGRNMPIKVDILDRLAAELDRKGLNGGTKLSLVGWSLGGILAREFAKAHPGWIDQVVTLGSPFSAGPRDNRAWRVYELAADHKVDAPPLNADTRAKPPCHTTAIWSSRDGIISVPSARGQPGERDVDIEIRCGHFAMSCAPDAMRAVLYALQHAPSVSSSKT